MSKANKILKIVRDAVRSFKIADQLSVSTIAGEPGKPNVFEVKARWGSSMVVLSSFEAAKPLAEIEDMIITRARACGAQLTRFRPGRLTNEQLLASSIANAKDEI